MKGRGLGRAKEGYTRKEIFQTKLSGEPFDVMRDNMAKDIDWLIKRKVFAPRTETTYRGEYTYRCLYPIRIYFYVGRLPYRSFNRDWLVPGDIWRF